MKPTEMPLGQNAGILANIIGKQHVSKRPRDVVRVVRKKIKNWRNVPKSLRRGVIKFTIETHNANRELFNAYRF